MCIYVWDQERSIYKQNNTRPFKKKAFIIVSDFLYLILNEITCILKKDSQVAFSCLLQKSSQRIPSITEIRSHG